MNEDVKKRTKLIRKAIIAVVILLFAAAIGWNSWYTLGEQEQAVVTTFGVPSAVTTPGIHFKIPFVQKVTKVTKTILGLAIGYDATTGESKEQESLMITYDYNFVNIDFYLEYRITDPVKVLYASSDPHVILKNLAQSYIRDTVGVYNVDDVITTGKGEIQAEIKEKIIARMEQDDIGIQVLNVTIQDSEPPTTLVSEAFKAVETAKQGKETDLNNANKYKNEQVPAAEARVDLILKQAEAEKASRINEAAGQAARFNVMYEEYIKFPLITKQRMFYEAMEDILPDMKVIIEGEGEIQQWLPLEDLGNTIINNNVAEGGTGE